MSTWRRCSSCKAEIEFRDVYWVCSVSTCTRPRTGYFFCSVSCWEAHLPTMRHREAWAVEKRAPTPEQWAKEQAEEEAAGGAGGGDDDDATVEERAGRRVATAGSAAGATPGATAVRKHAGVQASSSASESDEEIPRDILIVVSKLKKYIRARSGMNTSDNVMPVLSEYVRKLCDQAIRTAAQDGRKTVLDRDVTPLIR